jgi:hypothetical protein
MAAGLLRRAGPVADLVPAQAGFGDHLVGKLVLVGVVIVINAGNFTTADLGRELGAVLDNQGVGTDVVGLVGQRGFQGSASPRGTPPACAVNQVQADCQSRVPCPADHLRDTAWRVGTVQDLQDTCGTADCMPKETRVNPASFSTARDSGVTESGLASVVTSAPSSIPHCSMAARRILARSSAGSSVGVPRRRTPCSASGQEGPTPEDLRCQGPPRMQR